MTYIHTFHAGLPACLTDQALSACVVVEGIRFWPEPQLGAALRTFANETFI